MNDTTNRGDSGYTMQGILLIAIGIIVYKYFYIVVALAFALSVFIPFIGGTILKTRYGGSHSNWGLFIQLVAMTIYIGWIYLGVGVDYFYPPLSESGGSSTKLLGNLLLPLCAFVVDLVAVASANQIYRSRHAANGPRSEEQHEHREHTEGSYSEHAKYGSGGAQDSEHSQEWNEDEDPYFEYAEFDEDEVDDRPDKARDALDLLGMTTPYSLQQLKHRWKALLMRVHPDHGGSNALARLVNEAYDTLRNEL